MRERYRKREGERERERGGLREKETEKKRESEKSESKSEWKREKGSTKLYQKWFVVFFPSSIEGLVVAHPDLVVEDLGSSPYYFKTTFNI